MFFLRCAFALSFSKRDSRNNGKIILFVCCWPFLTPAGSLTQAYDMLLIFSKDIKEEHIVATPPPPPNTHTLTHLYVSLVLEFVGGVSLDNARWDYFIYSGPFLMRINHQRHSGMNCRGTSISTVPPSHSRPSAGPIKQSRPIAPQWVKGTSDIWIKLALLLPSPQAIHKPLEEGLMEETHLHTVLDRVPCPMQRLVINNS